MEPRATCAACAHFRSDALEAEQRIPGLTSLGSGFAAARAGDGFCERHDRYLSDRAHCRDFRKAP